MYELLLLGCNIPTGPYYDSVSGNCVFSCPSVFQGVYATGTCDPGEFKRDIICMMSHCFMVLPWILSFSGGTGLDSKC